MDGHIDLYTWILDWKPVSNKKPVFSTISHYLHLTSVTVLFKFMVKTQKTAEIIECSFKKLWCFDLILLWTRCPVTLLCWLQLYWLSSDNSQALGSWKFCTRRLEGWRCQKLQVCPPNFYTCKHFVSLCVRAEARTWSGPKRRLRGSGWSEQEL